MEQYLDMAENLTTVKIITRAKTNSYRCQFWEMKGHFSEHYKTSGRVSIYRLPTFRFLIIQRPSPQQIKYSSLLHYS